MLKLIAESGSSKTDWALLKREGQACVLVKRWQGSGINPTLLGKEALFSKLQGQLQELSGQTIQEVDFYGAGCENPDAQEWIKSFFKQAFNSKLILVANDLLAAAKACCGHEPGIVCILGTGSSSAYYDGREIADALPGLGFILGDEGSGTHIGKRLLQSFFYEHLPAEVSRSFIAWLSPNKTRAPRELRSCVLEQVYRQAEANRFLAALTHFITAHPHPFLSGLVQRCFDDFIHLLQRYPQSKELPVHFTGSIAFHFKKELLSVLQRRQLRPGLMLQSPMEGLLRFELSGK